MAERTEELVFNALCLYVIGIVFKGVNIHGQNEEQCREQVSPCAAGDCREFKYLPNCGCKVTWPNDIAKTVAGGQAAAVV